MNLRKKLNQRTQKHEDGTIERWRDVPNYEGRYRVSDRGRVKSVLNRRSLPGGILSPYRKKESYLRVVLRKNGDDKEFPIHQLVWFAFMGPIPKGLEINHKDGVKGNNLLPNLEVVTHAENIKHAYAMGLIPDRSGEGSISVKLTEVDVLCIRKAYSKGEVTLEDVSVKYGVCLVTVRQILRGETWTKIGGPIVKELPNRVAKVTEEQVREIRRLHDCGTPTIKIVQLFGVKTCQIRAIIRRVSWKHVK